MPFLRIGTRSSEELIPKVKGFTFIVIEIISLKKNYFVFQKLPSQNKFFHRIEIFFQTFYPMAILFSTFHPIEILFRTFYPKAAKNRSTEI